jgi:hypothetical protein
VDDRAGEMLVMPLAGDGDDSDGVGGADGDGDDAEW